MAPRLSRWIAMTAVAAVLVAVMFLTTGGAPLLYTGYGEVVWSENSPRTQLQRRMNGVQQALERVQARRSALELRERLAIELRRDPADPIAFTRSGNVLMVDREFTAALDSVWARMPGRHAEVRTVVLTEEDRGDWYNLSAVLDSTGVCIVRRARFRDRREDLRGILARAGLCPFAENYGLPGVGVSTWMKATPSGIPWGHASYRAGDALWALGQAEAPAGAWFTALESPWYYGSGWRYRPLGRSEMACLVGRPGACEAATGVTAAGWPGLGPRLGYIGQRLPSSAIPRDLLDAVGPDRFAQIWSSPDPIATSYARVTGASMDDWLSQWARRYVPEPVRDNGLSLLGWVGALLWLSLLGLLTAERLRQRTVT